MHKIAAFLVLALPLTVISPIIDMPTSYRTQNWAPYGEGSCVHASWYNLLHWNGEHAWAEWWKANKHSGERPETFGPQLDAAGFKWAETTVADVRFLEWCMATRRGCIVCVHGGQHMVTLVHLDATNAGILDSNTPTKIIWMTRQAFLDDWSTTPFKWAVTYVGTPPPPPLKR